MRRKVLVWLLFLLCLLLLSLGATPWSKTADAALISLRLTLIAIVSILAVREWWRHRHGDRVRGPDMGDTILQRLRRWYYGDEKKSN
jgi:uncharacterized membrane protein YbhN (UPF0104 family)